MSLLKVEQECIRNEMPLDQYSNVSAEVWNLYIGDISKRTEAYRGILTGLLRDNHCRHILDAACGTGFDSIMLLEEGFQVTSSDNSCVMLRFAHETRWKRRYEPGFDSWVIKRANWITLKEDLEEEGEGKMSFDAVLCIGNSFPALVATGDQDCRQMCKKALINMAASIKPGGMLFIDHMNFDDILKKQEDHSTSIYYSNPFCKIEKTTWVYENGLPCAFKRDYVLDVSDANGLSKYERYQGQRWQVELFPHLLTDFQSLLQEVFGPKAKYQVLGDYKPLDQCKIPSTFVHIVQKSI